MASGPRESGSELDGGMFKTGRVELRAIECEKKHSDFQGTSSLLVYPPVASRLMTGKGPNQQRQDIEDLGYPRHQGIQAFWSSSY